MPTPPPADPDAAAAPHAAATRRHRRRRIVLWSLAVWAVAAYIIVPRLWALYFHEHPYTASIASPGPATAIPAIR